VLKQASRRNRACYTLLARTSQLYSQIKGDSGLHFASERGHVAVVEALVDAGADVNAANGRSLDTPVMCCGEWCCCMLHVPAACRVAGWVLGVLMLAALHAWARRMAGPRSCPQVEMVTWQWWQRLCRGVPMWLLELYVEVYVEGSELYLDGS
jgi:ankyrin repeat protein